MLYIEDFLELIEPFPQELRERLTEMREIDLKIQNETDKLDGRVESFFQQCKKQKSDWKSDNCDEIRKEYSKLLENADDKVQIANQLYDLIEKYLKKLDQELQKFKLELEADHAGITSKLEQVISSKNLTDHASLSLNTLASNSTSFPALNLNFNPPNPDDSDFTLCSSSTNDLMLMMMNNNQTNNLYSLNENSTVNNTHKRKHSNFSEKSTNLAHSGTNLNDEDSSSSWNSSNLNLNNTILNLNRKGSLTLSAANKRTIANLTANRQSLDSNLLNLINSSIGTSSQKRPTAGLRTKRTKLDKHRNILKKSRLNELDFDDETYEDDENARNEFYQSDDNNETGDETNEAASEITSSENGLQGGNEDEDDLVTSDDDRASEDYENNRSKLKITSKNSRNQYSSANRQFKEDWNSGEDTNERYCICKDVSYGDMIMCDNTRCNTQWFHFVCVGLNSAPKGKWFCPNCAEIKKKRKEKHLNAIISANTQLNSMLVNNPPLAQVQSEIVNQLVASTATAPTTNTC